MTSLDWFVLVLALVSIVAYGLYHVVGNQSMQFFGAKGRIELEVSYNEAATSTRCSGTPPPVPLEDSVRNVAVIDARFRAAESGRWETVG